MNWSAQRPRWATLLNVMLGVCAAMVALTMLWPLISGNVMAYTLVAGILILVASRLFMTNASRDAARNKNIRSLSRIACSHWRVHFHDHAAEGRLQHVWYGWGWITLRIQPYAQVGAITLTVWRVNVSAQAWHQLRVWSAWELTMVTPPLLTETRQ